MQVAQATKAAENLSKETHEYAKATALDKKEADLRQADNLLLGISLNK